MKYIIDENSKEPYYIQLYKQLREDIVKGIYPYNDKLPSKRTIANETGVSTITVEHAYGLLSDEGYVEPKERSGYFIIFKKGDGFALFSESDYVQNKNLALLYPDDATNNNTFPFSVFAKTMRKVISDLGDGILKRSPNHGCEELKEELSLYLARSRGIFASPRQIIIGAGSEYLYGLIPELLGRDKRYAIESPSYKKIEQVYKAADITFDTLPLGNDGIESVALQACKADVLHVSPYRSFPSGVSATASKKHEYLRWAEKNNAYIVEDDFESEFSISKKHEETLFSHSTNDNVIYMNTFSKTVSPALRTGYMVLPKKLIGVFEEKLGFYSCTVPTFIQHVLAELISNGDFERHINRVRRQKRSKK